MKKFYQVEAWFYDNGKTKVYLHEVRAKEKPENYFSEMPTVDIYCDHFTTEEEANAFIADLEKV